METQPILESPPSRPKRTSRAKITHQDDSFDDFEAGEPPKKIKKVDGPARSRSKTTASKATSTVKATKPKQSPSSKADSKKQQSVPKTPNLAFVGQADLFLQCDGISLEQLKTQLSPQDYIRISIQRSLTESPHQVNEKNVTSKLHVDLVPDSVKMTYESELRSMIFSWIDVIEPPIGSIALLESEASKYCSQIIGNLDRVIKTLVQNQNTIHGRIQKPLKFIKQTSLKDVQEQAKEEINTNEDEYDNEYAEPEIVEEDVQGESENAKEVTESVPIATLDHLAESFIPKILPIRELECIVQRLAEESRVRTVQMQLDRPETLATTQADDDYQPSQTNESDNDIVSTSTWHPSPELEAFIRDSDPNCTLESRFVRRDSILMSRFTRAENLNKEQLIEWQLATSVSFARPKRLPKFMKWMLDSCELSKFSLFIPRSLAMVINFLIYEHLREVVYKAASLMCAQRHLDPKAIQDAINSMKSNPNAL